MGEVIFEAREDEAEDGLVARALGPSTWKRPLGSLEAACPHAAMAMPHARCAGAGDPAYGRVEPTTTSLAG